MKAIVYSRVSTDAQDRDGTSLDTQERTCLELAAGRGWRVVRCIRDSRSGSLLERHGLSELRAALRRREAVVVVAYAVDRLSRSQNHIGILFDEFERAEVRMEFVSERFEDTAVGRFILAARAFIAEVERGKDRRADDARQRGTRTGRADAPGHRTRHLRIPVRPGHRPPDPLTTSRPPPCFASSRTSRRGPRSSGSPTR